jgi:16S rRNA processing protein RimM
MTHVVVGAIRRAHGLEGGLLVQPETDSPGATYRTGLVFRVPDAPAGKPTELTLSSADPHAKRWRLHFREIGDRETAESYAGCALELPEHELAELAENEFFLHDFIGLEVRGSDGEPIGRVDWVFDRPGQPLLVVKDDDEDAERLIPFTPAIVTAVDLEAGVIHMDPPPGLLEP